MPADAAPRLVLHVGFPKCGSSSIQRSFSHRPLFTDRAGGRAGYGAIVPTGTLVLGGNLQRRAARSNARYVASAFRHLGDMGASEAAGWVDTARRANLSTLLLSREAWVMCPELLTRLVAAFPDRPRVVVFVRPQLDYLNSGWWQWGAWTGQGFYEWCHGARASCRLADRVEALAATLPGAEIRVHPLSGGDPVARCLDAMDCAPDAVPAQRANTTLPGPLLRLFQRHAARLRPGHSASGIDFVLGRALAEVAPGDPAAAPAAAPWVIPHRLGRAIIAHHRPGNRRLLTWMSPADRARVEADARWWDIAAHADRPVEPWRAVPPRPADVDALAATLAAALFNAGRVV